MFCLVRGEEEHGDRKRSRFRVAVCSCNCCLASEHVLLAPAGYPVFQSAFPSRLKARVLLLFFLCNEGFIPSNQQRLHKRQGPGSYSSQ